MISNIPQVCQNSFVANNTLTNYSGLSVKNEREREGQYPEREMKLFEEIKLEIREELRRHKEKTGVATANVKKSKGAKYNSLSEVKEKERIKSTNVNFLNLNLNVVQAKTKSQSLQRSPSKSSVIKTQLPALNSHILIISNSNSTKGLNHN